MLVQYDLTVVLDSTLACAVDNTCLFTTFGNSWMAGCCPTTSMDCPIATTWYVCPSRNKLLLLFPPVLQRLPFPQSLLFGPNGMRYICAIGSLELDAT